MTFDKVFLINLKERRDRLEKATEHFPNVNCPKVQVFFATKMDNGAEGLKETYRRLLGKCLEDETVQNILIFEDDVKFLIEDPFALINECMRQVPEYYHILFFGCNLFQRTPLLKHSENILKLDAACALHAMALSRYTMVTLLHILTDPFKDTSDPLDIIMANEIIPQGHCYCSIPMICSQHPGFSNIQGKETDYASILENRFAEKTKHLSSEK